MSQTSLMYILIILSLSLVYNIFTSQNFRLIIVLIFSIILYASFNIGFLFLLIFIIALSFYGARYLIYLKNNIYYYIILLCLLLPLFYYKYFLIIFNEINFYFIPVSTLNFGGYGNVLIPVGLSFFTFQALGYVIDVKNKKHDPELSFFHYSLFISFFPQLLAGPIERYKTLMFQLKESKTASPNDLLDGVLFIFYGFFLKLCLADRWGNYADVVFFDTQKISSLTALFGSYAFSIQLYGDFLGYTMIALGSAKLFGINLSENFKQPFLSKNINEFWQRWHISLTSWVFDYIYRGIAVRLLKFKYINNGIKIYITSFFTWIILGVWHGANLTFIFFVFI